MASRVADVHEQQPRGGGKQKIGQVEGRNRRVLRDIGNFEPSQAAKGKPQQQQISRPVTRSFCAELLANAQAAAEKNKKPLAEVVNGVVGKDGVLAQKAGGGAHKKERVKTKSEEVIVISSDEKEITKNRRSVKKTGKSLTSVLTARSKAACGLTRKPKEPIVDIDAADVDNELAAAEYVDDIYKYYKISEGEGRIHDYMGLQPEMNSKMRAILVDWLIEVHKKFELMTESLYLTINIVDRFLSLEVLPRKELQLVGISSMLIACKYEEIWAPEVHDFMAISDNAFNREQVLKMEKAILEKLGWYLTVPTPYVFLVRYVKASVPSDQEMEDMAFFFAELGLMHYSTSINYFPSKLAASAVYAARCTLNKIPAWNETLKHHTGYSEDQLMGCTKLLVSHHSGAAENRLKAVYRKFSGPQRGAVSLLPPARNLLQTTS